MYFLGFYIIIILLNLYNYHRKYIDIASVFIDDENENKYLKHLSSWRVAESIL